MERSELAATASPTGVESDVFIDPKLSWLEFNQRVLHEALDERTPLLERVTFLGIFTSNLDEFYMKRVGALKRQQDSGVASPGGRTPVQEIAAIRAATLPLLKEQARCYAEMVQPALAASGIHLLAWEDLTAEERAKATTVFHSAVFPVLTPLAVDPGHPFPFISNLSTSLGVRLRQPGRDDELFARVKVPESLPSWVRVDSNGGGAIRMVSLLNLIQHHLDALFPKMLVGKVMPFRVTRSADVERDEDEGADLLEEMTRELRERRFAPVVRLEHGPDPDPWILNFLLQELELSQQDVYELPGELDYTGLRPVAALPVPDLHFAPWTPVCPTALVEEDANIFEIIRAHDILVHHPYESFTLSVARFIRTAAEDPRVAAIKTTVYRTGKDSPFIGSLIKAAEGGKQVVCLVEVKARFDEQLNIETAQALEKAGVHVVYGIVGLKTHTKASLVVRRDSDGLRCYAHIGTGNYNVQTAKLYTDLGLFTCDKELTDDLLEFFNYLTGRSLNREYRKLMLAPLNLKERFLALIAREAEHQAAGRPAHIIAQINSLQDRDMGRALCQASQAGVRIDLIVRGMCCLRPEVPGVTENIHILSIVGRFLEHSRIFYFRNGATHPLEGEFFIGSADWMYRNLEARVEAVAPIENRSLRERLWEILHVMLHDQRQAWEMRADGSYVQRVPQAGSSRNEALGTHQVLMNRARRLAEDAGAQQPKPRVSADDLD